MRLLVLIILLSAGCSTSRHYYYKGDTPFDITLGVDSDTRHVLLSNTVRTTGKLRDKDLSSILEFELLDLAQKACSYTTGYKVVYRNYDMQIRIVSHGGDEANKYPYIHILKMEVECQ